MGVVYSTEQIKYGRVPSFGAHATVAECILSLNSSSISSLIIHGSVARENPSLRSDLDVVVFTTPGSTAEVADGLRMHIEDLSTKYKVVVEPHIEDPSSPTLDSDLHFYQFLCNTAIAHPGYTAGDPLRDLYAENLTLNPNVLAAQSLQYIKRKRSSFAKAYVISSTLDTHKMQRALELPSAIGRKALYSASFYGVYVGDFDIGNRLSMGCATRGAIENMIALSVRSADNLLETHDQLTSIDHEYTDLLDHAIQGEVLAAEYDEWLRAHYAPAIRLALSLSDTWLKVLNDLEGGAAPDGKTTEKLL